MNILITQSVTAGADIFKDLGDLRFIADNDLEHADLNDIDAIIMRSQSRVTVAQVKGTQVKFIGSATAGLDHLPVEALRALGVQVVNAPGCNANSVADYWLSALLSLEPSFQGKTLGIVGYGEVGQRIAKRAAALGLRVIVNDPPRVAAHAEIPFPLFSLPDLFSQSDIISLHVPLTTTGPWPTAHLIHAELLTKLKPGATLMNTARGEVCDAQALIDAKNQGLIANLILDVWPHEPDVDLALWQAATIATPHIAGHSYMAKWQGTWQVYEALLQMISPAVIASVAKPSPMSLRGSRRRTKQSRFLKVSKDKQPGLTRGFLPLALWAPPKAASKMASCHFYTFATLAMTAKQPDCFVRLRLPRDDIGDASPLRTARHSNRDNELIDLWHYIQQVYDVTKDHDAMHAWLTLPKAERIKAFKDYRRDYPMRSELGLATVSAHVLTPWQRDVLLSAGVALV